MTILNGAKWLDNCFESIARQKLQTSAVNSVVAVVPGPHSKMAPHLPPEVSLEICVFDDCSQDATPELLEKWQQIFNQQLGWRMCVLRNCGDRPRGGEH